MSNLKKTIPLSLTHNGTTAVSSARRVLYTLHILTLLSLTALLSASGCRSYMLPISKPLPQYHYYLNSGKDLPSIGRVALVSLANESTYPQISEDTTEALFQALQKKQVFGLTIINQDNPAWRSMQLSPNDTYTLDQLVAMRKALKCNAVLIGTITEFKPYPHMVVGLRLKILDLRDGQLVWAIEQIWDTADKTTERRIKKYFEGQLRTGYAPLNGQLATISSLNFIKFVAYEVSTTI